MSTTSQPTGRLISHFTDRSLEKQSSGWSELWDSDESSLWDRGKPSPALIDFIESDLAVLPRPEGRRPKALVPGCGKGYDVAMLALHGIDVVGLEVSETGSAVAEAYTASELKDPSAYNFRNGKGISRDGAGETRIVTADFFAAGWQAGLTAGGFDLIYDYTFLCALPPPMRRPWANRMRQLLAPSGILVCLEFPLYKDPAAPGPPWSLRGVHWDLLAEGGSGVLDGAETSGAVGGGAFERILYIEPRETYEMGKGTDMLSVWKLKAEEV